MPARPLDARPGRDPFAGTDPRYSCDAIHKRGACHRRMVRTARRRRRDVESGPQRAARRPRQRRPLRGAVGRRPVGRLQALGPAEHPGRPGLRRQRQGLHLRQPRHQHDRGRRRRRLDQGALRSRDHRLRRRRGTCCTSAAGPSATTRSATASGSRTRRSAADLRYTQDDLAEIIRTTLTGRRSPKSPSTYSETVRRSPGRRIHGPCGRFAPRACTRAVGRRRRDRPRQSVDEPISGLFFNRHGGSPARRPLRRFAHHLGTILGVGLGCPKWTQLDVVVRGGSAESEWRLRSGGLRWRS